MVCKKVEVQVPTDLLEAARRLVNAQDFMRVDDVIIEALYRFVPFIESKRRQKGLLKEEIQKGIDSADRGECVDGPKFMEELIANFRRPGQALQ